MITSTYSAIAFILRKCVNLCLVRAKCKDPVCFHPVSYPASVKDFTKFIEDCNILISGLLTFTPPRKPELLHDVGPPSLEKIKLSWQNSEPLLISKIFFFLKE